MTDLRVNSTTLNNQFTANTPSQPLQNVSVGDDGSFVVTWVGAGQDGNGTGIYYGLYDAAGNAVVTELQVNVFTTGSQQNAAVAKSDIIDGVPSSGGFVITWTSPVQDGPSSSGVYAQLYDRNGNVIKTEFQVNTTTLGTQSVSSVAMDEDGDFVITWSSPDGDGYGIYAQRYNAAGVAQGSEFLVNTQITGAQSNAVVAMDQDGDYVVAWVSSDGNGNGIYARRFNADGTPKDNATEFLVNTFTTDNQSEPSIAMDDAGNFVVTWSSLGQDGSSNGVYAQRFDAAGVPLGSEFRVSTRTAEDQKNSTVSMTPDGDFVITWSSFSQDATGTWGVYGQRYNSEGGKQGSEFKINTTVSGNQQYSSVGVDADGGFVTVWTGPDTISPASTGVYLNRFEGYTNNPPTVANPIPNAPTQTEDLPGSYSFPEATFTDPDGDTLTYTASLSGGIPLPNWIVFNAATRTFNFNPTNSEGGGVYTIRVTANDNNGGTVFDEFDVTVIAVNDAPTLNNPLPDRTGDTDSAFEDTPFSYTFAADTFQDIDSPILTYTAQQIVNGSPVALPSWLSFNSTTRTFSGTPDEADAGFLTIRVTASDGFFQVSDTFQLEVKDINDNPIADNDTATTNEETPVVINVLEGDTDPDGTLVPGTVVVVGNPANGTAVVNADGTITYTPTLDFAGSDTFTYTVQDNDGGVSNTATVTVTVNGVNDKPIANDDTVTMDEDGISPIIDVLANDTDVEGVATLQPGSVVVVSGSANGTTAVDPLTGKITYTPNPNYNGTDSFTYTVQDADGGTSDPATVTITVTSINDDPVANNDVVGTPQDTAVTFNVLENDTDVEGNANLDPASIVIGTAPLKGTLQANPDGTFTYTPTLGATGSDSFTYQVSDNEGGTSEFATVTLNITARPIAGDDTATTDEDSGVTIAVLTNDSDPDGTLVAGSVAIATAPTHGTAVVNADGTITYTPTGNYFGPDSFTYTVKDNSGSTSLPATVNITVNSINDLPTAVADSITTQEDTAVNINVLANDPLDIDGTLDPTSVTVTTNPASGTVVVNPDGSITYTPNSEFSGDDSFSYTVSDDEGGTSAPAVVSITVNSVNDPPVASNDSATTNEDTAAIIDVTQNDTDVDGTVVEGSILVTSSPAHGTAIANPDGTITYTPDPNYHGPDSFTYTVKDNNGAESAPATVNVTVVDVNDSPTARNDVGTVDEDPITPLTIDVLANDDDIIDGTLDPNTVTIVTNAQHGTIVVNADGTVTYTPNLNFNGTDSFTYTVKDDDGAASNVATVNITVNDINDAPIADDDTVTATENLDAVFSVLVGDVDVDGTLDPTSLAVVSNPGNGTVVANADGTFTYTPNPGFNGTDSFTYTVNDNQGVTSNVATVNITVTANALPTANNDTSTTIEDVPSLPINVLGNDSDIDGVLIPGSVAIASTPTNGTATVNPDGTIVYTPNPDFSGTDSFTYTVTDNANGTSAPATVTVTVTGVNDLPTAGDDTTSTNEDTAKIINVLANDNDSKDADGSLVPGSVAIATGPAHGTVVVNANGTITYTPTLNYFGSDSFTYTVNDNSGATSAPATVTITVNDVNDPPVATNDSQTTNEDTAITLDVLANDSDVDGTLAPGSVLIGTDPTHGTVTVNPDGTVTYTPNENFNGTDSFTYTVEDDDGTVSNVATVNITVDAVNDSPVAVDDSASVTENTATTITVLTNDSDVEGSLDASTVVIGTLPTHGTVVVNANGTITYTPNTGYLGSDSFTYTVKDGAGAPSNAATVNLSVTPNILPTANPDSETTAEDTPITISVLANDTDPDGSLIPGSVTVVDDPTNGMVVVNADGSINYTPNENFNGTDTFTYTVTDSAGGTSAPATVTVTVNDVNDLPVASNDTGTTNEDTAVTIDVLANDIEVDGSLDAGSVTIGTNPTNGTVVVNPDGTITYTPNNNYSGSDSFTYSVKDDDGESSNVATVNVTVTAVNDVPAAGDDTATTNEDTPVTNINVLQNDTDVDGTIVPGTVAIATQSANGTAVVNADGTITFTPAANFNGTTTFTYTVKDNQGGTSAPATVTVTVNSINDAPVAVNDAETTSEDVALTISILGNDSDVDGSLAPGSVVIGTQPTHGTVTLNANGSVLYTPNPDYNGTDSFTYTVKDNNGASSNPATVNITITAGNDPPVLAIPIPDQTATEDSPFTYSFPGGTFTEPDGDTLTYTATLESGAALPGWLSFNPITRMFSGTPTNSDVGAIAIKVTAADPAFSAISDTFTLTIGNVNDAPTAGTPIPEATATEGSPFSFTVPAGSFVDVDAGDTLTYSATLSNGSALPPWLSFDPATQTFTGTPGNNDVEPLTIRVKVSDTGLATATSDFTLTINPVNDAPTVAATIANQTATEDSLFTFTVPSGTFSDPDGDVLTYSATLADGSSLPGWLAFNPLTRSFSGTPTNGDVGTLSLRVIVTDPFDATNSTTFDLTIDNVNDAPTVGTAIPEQTATEDSPFTFTVPAGSFIDIDPGATLTYTASLAGGAALPSWLSFNPATQTFSGTPNNGNVGSITLQVQATDGFSPAVTSTFTLTVTNINTPPTLVIPLVDQNATEDAPFSFTVPAGSFTDPDAGDSLTYTATLEDGNPLPVWLIFNPDNQTFSGTPTNGNVGTINVKITATDGAGASVSDVMQVAIANTNDAPILNSAIANQSATEGNAFSFTLPPGKFSDPDLGDSLTYTATLSNGNPLPAWLTFNTATQTFSGTPGNADVSTSPLTIQVLATDQAGASVAGNFTLTIENVNNPPELANPITNKAATEDNLFSFALPVNTFTDPDGDTLTYSATLGSGSALPAWLTFNPTTRTFSGTPTNANVGTITVKVIATDTASATNSTTFDLTVSNVNDPPTVAIPIPNQTATRDTLFNYTFPTGTFTDIDTGDILTYTATLADGTPIPAWLSFDAATRTFSGTPGIADVGVGSLSIRVRATDSGGAVATSIFSLTLVNPNTAPSVAVPLTDKAATEDSSFTFTVPSTTFTDPDPGDSLTYTATLASGAALPAWLSFNPTTRTFSGTPRNGDVGSISVRVTVTDKAGSTTNSTFNLAVANTNDAPTLATPLPDQTGKENNPFTFVVPATTFTDVDAGDSITYTAQLSSGAGLPNWLTFNPTTRTFSGTPTTSDIGSFSIRVTGTDNQGASTSDIFNLTIDSAATANAAPVVANPIPDQTIGEGTALNFTFAANAFTDANGDPMTYTARLDDGSPLPGWLTFNPATRNFSTAPTGDSEVGVYNILVTASDPFFASASDSFTFRVSNINDAPAVIPSRGSLPYLQGAMPLDDALTIIDVDSPTLSGANVRFTSGYVPGQDILTFTPQGGIAGSFNNSTGVLTLIGSASPEVYQTVLRSVMYQNNVANSTSPPRTIQIKVSDQALDSTPQQLQVIFQNRPPVLDLNGADPGVDFSTSGQAGTQIPVVDTDLVVSDADGSVISSALIVISNPIDWIQEQLKVNTAGTGISAVYNSESGTLALTGSATIAAYQQVLRTLTYSNMAVDPNATVRKILFIINDGKNNSIQAETTLTLTPGAPSGGGGDNSGGGNSGGGSDNPEPPVRGPSSLATSLQVDVINAPSSNDTVTTSLANLQQNDTINGGSGIDTLILSDGTGIAIINVATSGSQVEGIIPPGTIITNFEQFDFSGFSGNTTMTGSDSLDDVLIGGLGRDRLFGLAGNDTLVGNGSKDKLNGGTGNDNLDGGKGKDKLIGGDGNDTLKGNGGKDILKGGVGADAFVVTSSKKRDRDVLRDFNAAEDVIQISRAGFSNQLTSGQLSASQFVLGSQAADRTDRFIYNQSTGALFFDIDGTGGSTQVQIATLSKRPTLTAADIVIIP